MNEKTSSKPKKDHNLQITLSGSEENPTVSVVGPTNTGKTTIARIIEEALKKAGFEVSNLDPDAKNRGQGLFPVETDRMRRLAEGKKVRIVVANTR